MLGVGGSVIWYFIVYNMAKQDGIILPIVWSHDTSTTSGVPCTVRGGGGWCSAMCKVYLVTICIDIVS